MIKTLTPIFILILVSVVHAEPNITTVSGTVATGQLLTITGVGLVGMDTTGWENTELEASFEGASYSADGYVQYNGNPTYDTGIYLLGSQSMKSEVSAGGGATCGGEAYFADAVYMQASGGANVFSRFYIRYNSDMGNVWALNQYNKLFYYAASCNLVFDFYGTGWPTSLTADQLTNGATTMSLPSQMVADRWYSFEFEHNYTESVTRAWVDGQLIGEINASTTSANCTAPLIPNTNSCATSSVSYGDAASYVDGFVQSSARVYPATTVEISGDDGSTWTYQPPTFISDTSTVVSAELPTLTATDYILRVTDNAQTTSGTYSLGATTGPVDPTTGLTKGTEVFSESFEDNSWATRDWYDDTTATGSTVGGYSGNALKWEWTTAATQPTGFSTIRNTVGQEIDEFLIEYYVKYDSGWQGSGQVYHPHLIHILSSDDTAYQGLAASNSAIYLEAIADTTSPYDNFPTLAHQDLLRAVSATNDLTSVTETRSANTCDTPYLLTGATDGDCYDAGGWYSANMWKSQSVTIPGDEWVKITAYVKMNTFTTGIGNFDGIMKLWVNADLAVNSETVLYAAGAYEGSTWDKIALAPYIGDGSPIAQSMWVDELSIWTIEDNTPEPTGTITAYSLSDGSVTPYKLTTE